MSGRRAAVSLAAVVALFALGLLVSRAALAKDGDVIRRATCTAGSTAKLKLSPEGRGIEVELEVDQNRNRVRWRVRIVRSGGGEIFAGSRVTRPPSGSFEVRRVISNEAGTDTIRARATSPSGEICRIAASFTAAASADSGDDSGASSAGSTSGASTSGGTTSGGDDNGSGGHGSDG